MKARRSALLAWLAGYAALAAGTFSLAGVPAAASGGSASVILLGLMGLGQVLWGTSLALRPSARLEWIGVGVNAGAAAIAWFGTSPPSVSYAADPAIGLARMVLSLTALGLGACLVARPANPETVAFNRARNASGLIGVALGSALLLSALWFSAMAVPVNLRPPAQARGDPAAIPTAHTQAHPEDAGHQGTYRVRLTGAMAGPYVVQAFTGPTEVGDLFVEVGVRDAAGAVLENLTIAVEASPAEGSGAPVGGTATSASAQIPGNYAVHLPVASTGFWTITLTIIGTPGTGTAAFSERVGGTANLAGWVLAGVPLAIAVLFGLLFFRTAGRGRG